jgi:hypothetical protein
MMCPHRPETWAGSRAGPPVSECVSPVLTAPQAPAPEQLDRNERIFFGFYWIVAQVCPTEIL